MDQRANKFRQETPLNWVRSRRLYATVDILSTSDRPMVESISTRPWQYMVASRDSGTIYRMQVDVGDRQTDKQADNVIIQSSSHALCGAALNNAKFYSNLMRLCYCSEKSRYYSQKCLECPTLSSISRRLFLWNSGLSVMHLSSDKLSEFTC